MRSAVMDDELVFRFADPDHAHEQVGVWMDVELGVELGMSQVAGGWELRLGRPDLDCVEYLLDVDGALAPDPTNPDTVDGAFGPHSWLALPGYRPPAWLDAATDPGTRTAFADDIEVWSPTGHETAELPLLLVHDGPEMDGFGAITTYAATRPPMRVALLAPGARDERYSADPAYAAELVDEVIPKLLATYPTRHRPVLIGQSLGGLAALHAGWTSPTAFAGLMLQSGSFFTPVLDPQESAFGRWDRVTEFVASFHASTGAPVGFPPVAMSCGTAEENLANNRLVHQHLTELDVPVTWGEVRQGHTWTCWRDTLDPHLTGLLARVWG